LPDRFGMLAGHRTISLPRHKREDAIVTDTSQVRDNRPKERGWRCNCNGDGRQESVAEKDTP
jgi:hypothetical protein